MTSVTPPAGARTSLALAPSRGGWRLGVYASALLVLTVVLWWVSTHPEELETSDATVIASTPTGQSVFLGVFGTAGFDRTLHVAGVRVFATATAEVTIIPRVCHGGSVNVTTTPEAFCSELGTTEGATLERGDEIVLEVVGDVPAVVDIDRVRIAYRDGLQWATQDAGARSAVSILAR